LSTEALAKDDPSGQIEFIFGLPSFIFVKRNKNDCWRSRMIDVEALIFSA
jgi:hypothetical protein